MVSKSKAEAEAEAEEKGEREEKKSQEADMYMQQLHSLSCFEHQFVYLNHILLFYLPKYILLMMIVIKFK